MNSEWFISDKRIIQTSSLDWELQNLVKICYEISMLLTCEIKIFMMRRLTTLVENWWSDILNKLNHEHFFILFFDEELGLRV